MIKIRTPELVVLEVLVCVCFGPYPEVVSLNRIP